MSAGLSLPSGLGAEIVRVGGAESTLIGAIGGVGLVAAFFVRVPSAFNSKPVGYFLYSSTCALVPFPFSFDR